MNRSKLTPCRKVGLSRKKNTPIRTVDSLLTVRSISQAPVTPISIKQQQQKTTTPNTITQQIELNYDTPCRQVGLSRKRKTLTPLSDIKTVGKVPITPSLPTHLVKKTLIDDKLTDITSENNENQSSCAISIRCSSIPYIDEKDEFQKFVNTKKYSLPTEESKFSMNDPPLTNIGELEKKNKVIVEELDQINKLGNSVKSIKHSISNGKSNTSKDESLLRHFGDLDDKKEVIVEELKAQSEHYLPMIPKNVNDVKLFDKKDKNQFLKVCYKSEKANCLSGISKQNIETKNLSVLKKPKFSRKIFDDGDDFEVSPKRIQSKKLFGRYETDVGSLEKRVSNKESVTLKKSLSVGDEEFRNFSTLSKAVSENSITDCFVKIKKMTNITTTVTTPQDLSDDDFDTLTPTPPISIRSKIDNLEKEVKQKRNVLEELERAKIYRKLHDINELTSLTSTWENGCKLALSDLLEQLNTHTEMNMEVLLKKLNIPANFMSLSQ